MASNINIKKKLIVSKNKNIVWLDTRNSIILNLQSTVELQ